MTREVYIGNNTTINVQTGNVKNYDWDKLQELLNTGIELVAGMKEDWFFTSQKVEQEDIDNQRIAGLSGSDWATPSVFIDDEIQDCYIEIDDNIKRDKK